MKKEVHFKGAKIIYEDRGTGPALLFLHGYLETKEIWEFFIDRFINNFRIICLDIPGHGESGTWGTVHSMDDIASLILFIMDQEDIDNIILIGHSMGGYISMAFAELFRERLRGYCLFHSTCFADSEEKKLNRDREISLVKCGKKAQIIKVNITKGYALDNIERLQKSLERSKMIAFNCQDDGVIALLNGMKNRPDRTHILSLADLPVLLIGGMKDNYITVETFEKLIEIAPHAEVLKLYNSGHMGFIEEQEKASEAILSWLKA